MQIDPIRDTLGRILGLLVLQWKPLNIQAFDESGQARGILSMTVKVLFRREQCRIKKFYEGIELVGIELHRRGSEEQQSSCKVLNGGELLDQVV